MIKKDSYYSKIKNNKCWQRCIEKSTKHVVGIEMDTTIAEDGMKILQKSEIRSNVWPSHPIPGNIPKGNNSSIWKSSNTPPHPPSYYNSIIHNSEHTESPRCASTDDCLSTDKENMVYVQDGKLLSHIKEWNLSSATKYTIGGHDV